MLQIVRTIALSATAVLVGACIVGSENTPRSDPFMLNDAAVAEDVLTVSVSYAGGCRSTSSAFSRPTGSWSPILSNSGLTSSMTPTVTAVWPRLAWITEQHSFDLSDIRARWREAYRQESGIVQLGTGVV